MPKAKLRIASKDVQRVKNALEMVDGTVVKESPMGPDTILTVSVKSNADLWVACTYLPHVSDKAPEVKAPAPAKAETKK